MPWFAGKQKFGMKESFVHLKCFVCNFPFSLHVNSKSRSYMEAGHLNGRSIFFDCFVFD